MPPFFKSFHNSSSNSSSSTNKNKTKQQTHYNVLELSESASLEEIKSARKRLAKAYHPDKNPDNENFAHVKQQQINEAYRILSDEKLRADYDYQLKYGKKRNFNNNFGPQGDNSSDYDDDEPDVRWFEKPRRSDEPLYRFYDPRTGEETFFTKEHIYRKHEN